MTPLVTSNPQTNQGRVWINGRYIPAKKVGNIWTYELNGQSHRVDVAQVKATPKEQIAQAKEQNMSEVTKWLRYFYEKGKKKYAELREKSKELGQKYYALKEQVKAETQKLNDYIAQCGASKIDELHGAQRTQAAEYVHQISSSKKARNRTGRAYSATLSDGFNIALNNIKWSNLYALSEQCARTLSEQLQIVFSVSM